jgi:magnesium-transporting ATPase (P-type)
MTDEIKVVLDDVINKFASKALRTIAVAYKDLSPNENGVEHDEPKDQEIKDVEKSGLTLICIFGIMDIVR